MLRGESKAARRKQRFNRMCLELGVNEGMTFEDLKKLAGKDKRFKKVTFTSRHIDKFQCKRSAQSFC